MSTDMHIKNLPSRQKRRRKRLASRIIFIAALIVMLISGIQLARIFINYHKADSAYDGLRSQGIVSSSTDETEEERFHFDVDAFLALHEEYPELVGWIIIEDTDINYPLMYRPGAEGNSYYLSHDFSGAHSINGSIFIDTANDMYLNDAHTVIYGHHMKSGAMFADLLDFRDEDFALEHSVVNVWMIDETDEHVRYMIYDVISSHSTLPDGVIYTLYGDADPEGEVMTGFADSLIEMSDHDYVVPQERNNIITLSTCIGDTTRYVLHCVLTTEELLG